MCKVFTESHDQDNFDNFGQSCLDIPPPPHPPPLHPPPPYLGVQGLGVMAEAEAPVANFFLRISAKILSISENF